MNHRGAPKPAVALRPLAAADVPAVVALHRAALPYTFNCRLGAGHLARLYAALLREPAAQVTLAEAAGQVVGVVSAVLDPGPFVRGFMRRQTLRNWAELAVRLALRPTLLRDWRAGQATSRPLVYKGQVVAPTLTAIAVSAGSRRLGAGRLLVASVDQFVRAHGGRAYGLDTLVSNLAARAFYARLGFIEVETRGPNIMLVKEL